MCPILHAKASCGLHCGWHFSACSHGTIFLTKQIHGCMGKRKLAQMPQSLHAWICLAWCTDAQLVSSACLALQKGRMSNAHGSPELHSQLAAASHSLSLIEDMHPGSNDQWPAEARPPGATASHRNLDDSRSCTYPSAFMQPASVPLGHADTSPQLLQQQLPPLPQRRSQPPSRFLAQTQSAPPTGSLDYLTWGASTHLRQPAANGLSSDRLDGNQLADYIGLSRSANTFGQRSGPISSQPGFGSALSNARFPHSGFQQSCQRSSHSAQLQGSFSTTSSVGLSSQTAFEQSGSFAMPRSPGRPRPMVQNAFSSHQGLASGLHSKPQSPFGMSPGISPESSSDRLLQPQSAFPLTLQSSLQAALDQLPKRLKGQGQKEPAAYHASSLGQPDGSSVFPMPFRSSPYGSNVTMGSSSHLNEGPAPTEATSMDICQTQGLSAASNQPATVKHHDSAGAGEKGVHGLAQPRLPFSGSFSQWQNLAPSPFAVSKPDPSSWPSLGALQSMGHHPEALHPQILVEDCSHNGTSAEVQRCSEPDAMRKAALALNAQLAQIDKQVLEHIMPRCGHHARADPQQADSCIIAHQVLLSLILCVSVGSHLFPVTACVFAGSCVLLGHSCLTVCTSHLTALCCPASTLCSSALQLIGASELLCKLWS